MPARYNVRDWFREDIEDDTEENAALWRAWFSAHGIDPDLVLYSGWVERRTMTQSRENKILWLTAGTRDEGDGPQPISLPRETDLDDVEPAPFPVA